jgi:predicted Na+-dependent transporter
VIVALVVYVAGSAALGGVLALRAPAGQATAILLPVAMRDFAVAAGIAAAAFGPAAAAPLGAYGVLVLLVGSAVAIIARRRPAPDRPAPDRPGPGRRQDRGQLPHVFRGLRSTIMLGCGRPGRRDP